MSVMVSVLQDFTVRGAASSRVLHQRGEAVMAELVSLSEAGGILDGSAGVDSARNVVQLGVTVTGEDLSDGIIKAVTAMRTAIHAAGDSTPGWPSSRMLLDAVASTIHADLVEGDCPATAG